MRRHPSSLPTGRKRRKARDAELRSQDDAIAEHLAKAMRSGELRSAPSFGKPMPPAHAWQQMPVEFRLPCKILKSAGMTPPEVGSALPMPMRRQADSSRRSAPRPWTHDAW